MTEIANINLNNVNTQNISSKNISRYSEAPARIFTYSLNNKLKEKDEFRRNVKDEISAERKSQERNNILKKALLIGGGILGFIILERKKII